jgi:hypothetical protein
MIEELFSSFFVSNQMATQKKKIMYSINNTMSVQDIRKFASKNIPLTKDLAQKINKQAIEDAAFLREHKLKKENFILYA